MSGSRRAAAAARRRLAGPRALLRAALLALRLEVVLRRRSLPRLAAWAGVALDTGARPGALPLGLPSAGADRRAVAAVQRVYGRWPVEGTCLRQSLVAGRMLRHLEPRLHVGVGRDAGTVRAHAWLEVQGHTWDPLAVTYARVERAAPPAPPRSPSGPAAGA